MTEQPEKHTLSLITISKDNLLQVLKENLEAHNELFNASTQAYHEARRARLEQMVEKSKALTKSLKKVLDGFKPDDEENFGEAYQANPFNIAAVQKPVSHEDSYIAAIRKIELSVHDEFTLTEKEFGQYVLNQWSWAADFINTASAYSTGLSGLAVYSGINKFTRKA